MTETRVNRTGRLTVAGGNESKESRRTSAFLHLANGKIVMASTATESIEEEQIVEKGFAAISSGHVEIEVTSLEMSSRWFSS